MMIQALGSVLIAAGAVWMGLSYVANYRRQVREIEDLTRGLALLEQELEFSAVELECLGERVGARSSGAGKALFEAFAGGLNGDGDQSASQLWQQSVLRLDHLPSEVSSCLLPLGEILGRYESGEQRRCVRAVRCRLEDIGNSLREQSKTNCRLSQTVALSGGAFLIILLL